MEIKEHLHVALVQFDIEWESVDANLQKIDQLIDACKLETDIIVLPEVFNTGFSTNSASIAEKPDGKTVLWMQTLSARRECAVCGSIFVTDEGNLYNRFFWVEPNGKILTYNKRHLFSMGGESDIFTAGNKQLIIEYKGWRIFPQICYDLRFPVWSRNVYDYDLLLNVANWPAARNEVWKILLKARAIENQCYVVAVNRLGADGNNVDHVGNSLVIDPKGIKIFNAHHREMIESVILDYRFLHNFREKFNTLKDNDDFLLINL